MNKDTKTKEACDNCLQLLKSNTSLVERVIGLEKRLIEVKASRKAYQKFTLSMAGKMGEKIK